MALVGETVADVRDVMVMGDSGIMACTPKDFRPTYIANRRTLEWPNGATALLFSAIEPDQLRGPQFDLAWTDELAKWRYAQDAWDMLQMGLRLGDNPRALVTTTPRNIKVLKDILADPATVSTRSSTYENEGNLAASYKTYILRKYGGTRLGRQEIEAAILDDVPGALWSLAKLDTLRIKTAPGMDRIVIAIDPPVTSGEAADECGMIVAGSKGNVRDMTGKAYVLADISSQGKKPSEWARDAVDAYHTWNADCIVAETNNGGELVEEVIRAIDPLVKYKSVHASKGKFARAEPISALYDQDRVHHVGTFATLEDQMSQMRIDGLPDDTASPDRVDALVWALFELLVKHTQAEPSIRGL